jgi:hypothetical protein
MLPSVPPPSPPRRHVQMGASRCRSVVQLDCKVFQSRSRYCCSRQPWPAGQRGWPLSAGARGCGARPCYRSGSVPQVADGAKQVLGRAQR